MGVLSFSGLVREVGQRSGDSPLDRVEAALRVSGELASGADDLIGHFVAEARQAGCSWTQIGERIGVSKQAARQRFTVPPAHARLGSLEQQPRLGQRRRRRGGKAAGQHCSFCGRAAASGTRMVAGPGVWICGDCVKLAGEILAEQASAQAGPPPTA